VNVTIPDKKLFLSSFLLPLSKINDSCVIQLDKNGFNCTVATSDASVILFSSYKLTLKTEEKINLNISDIKKVIKAFEGISADSFAFTVDRNNISYSGSDVRFIYHLLEDGIITKPKIDVAKINQLEFPVNFTIQYKTILDLLRGSTFATESNKLYLYTEDGKIIGDLTDKSRHNVDSISIPIAEFSGTLGSICLNFELIRIISGVRVKQLQCSINPKIGIILFHVSDNIVTTKYIASSLIK